MLSLEISSLASACGKNKFEPRVKTILLLLCRKYPEFFKALFLQQKLVNILDDSEKPADTELKKIYKKFKKDIVDPKEFSKLADSAISKLTETTECNKEDIEHAKQFLEASMKKDCGTNNESSVITKKKYTKGNNEMYYYTSDNGWQIKGLHDATDSNTVIEIKTRMRHTTVRKNEYDLYQLYGYLLAMNKTKGKIVQYFNKQVFDSDTETEKEYGLIDISQEPHESSFVDFMKELDSFFEEVKSFKVENFDLFKIVNMSELPIACLDSNGVLHNVNPKYERILYTIFKA
jgi:hypothetical protein